MANPLKGEVALPPVAVAGFERGGTLLLDFNGLCTLEGDIGPVAEAGERVLTDLAPLRAIFRILLLAHHGEVGDQIAGQIVQAIGSDAARALAAEAFQRSFPEAAGESSADPRARANPGGTSPAAAKSGQR